MIKIEHRLEKHLHSSMVRLEKERLWLESLIKD